MLFTLGLAHAAPVAGQGTWETTLKARDIAGNAVALDSASAAFFYDTTLKITWMANMNQKGEINWSDALAWADSLTTGGFTDWRLPTIAPNNGLAHDFTHSYDGTTDVGYAISGEGWGIMSEWGHLYYVTLGNLALYDTNGDRRSGDAGVDWGLANTAYFQNMQSSAYWSGTALGSSSPSAWYFDHFDGYQSFANKENFLRVVAVRSGDVLRDGGTVPEPQSLALALTALAGLGLGRRLRRPA